MPSTEILELHWLQHSYTEIAASAVIIWDYFITFDREVDLFWGRRRTATSLLFFLNRYMVIIGQLGNTYSHLSSNVTYTFCKVAIAYWLTGFGMAQILLTEIIIYIRVCAMYTGQKQLHRRLLIFLVIATIGSTTILGLVGSRSKGTSEPYPGKKRCTVSTPYGFLWAYWLPILAYESTMWFLVMRKVVDYLKERRKTKNSTGGWTSDLVHVILRDSVIYFVLMFVLFSGNGILFGQKDPSLAGMLEPLTFVLLALMGSRMLMNLRDELLVKDVVATQVTTLGFARNAPQPDETTSEEDEAEDSAAIPVVGGSSHASQATSLSGPSTMV